MGTTRAALTEVDLRTLLKGATADERAVAAHKLCRTIDREALTAEIVRPPPTSFASWPPTPPSWCVGRWR